MFRYTFFFVPHGTRIGHDTMYCTPEDAEAHADYLSNRYGHCIMIEGHPTMTFLHRDVHRVGQADALAVEAEADRRIKEQESRTPCWS